MILKVRWWFGFLAAGSLSAAPAPPSQSRISVHLLSSYSPGASQIIQAHPRVIKILGTDGGMMSAARDFKASTPEGKVVCRIYTARRWSSTEDPATAGSNFWDTVLAPSLLNLSAADKALIDYVEGPNEGDSTPTWGSASDSQWFNTFWMHLASLIANAGFRPLAFSISVGNPPGTIGEIQATLDRIAPALRLCQNLGGGWSYHAYSLPYGTNVAEEIWYSLRYRQYYSYFASRHPDLSNLPLVMTEGGIDGIGPWSTRGDAIQYQNWLSWFDSELRRDSYCLGVTLFQIGNTTDWAGFNVEPVAGWIASHLSGSPGTNSTPATPTNLRAVAAPSAVRLFWNASAGANGYRIQRSGTNGGPYALIGTAVGTTFTNTFLPHDKTFYFIVTAINSAGESPPSVAASAQPLPPTLPGLLGAFAPSPSNVMLHFLEPVDAAKAGDTAHYTLGAVGSSQPMAIASAVLSQATNVLLATDPQAPYVNHVISVSNLVAAGSPSGVTGLNARVVVRVPVKLMSLNEASLWTFNDAGANLGTTWREPGYNDASWPRGPALLGFDTGPLPEPIRTAMTLASGRINYYVRGRFYWPYTNAAATLSLRQVIDDGVVFYVNGKELHRTAMSGTAVAWTNLATRTVDQAAYEGPFVLSATNLVSGTNVIAAEVHQASGTSGDIIFGASVDAWILPSTLAQASPILQVQPGAVTGTYRLSWVPGAFLLESASTATGPWTLVSPQTNPWLFVANQSSRFFRLRQ